MDRDQRHTDETTQAYARAGLGRHFVLGDRPAIVIVDFTYGFTDADSPLGFDLSSEIEATRRLLDVARRRGISRIFTTVSYDSELGDVGIWAQKNPSCALLTRGSRWVAVDERLGRRDDEPLIDRRGPSAVFATNLVSMLVAAQCNTVVLCGATTSGCIRATAVDLMQYGFVTVIPRACVGDRALGPHEASLIDMDAKYSDVLNVERVLNYLSGPEVAVRSEQPGGAHVGHE